MKRDQRARLQKEQEGRAAALSAAAQQREQLQRVADHVPVILANVGPDRRFKFVNKANADRFGVTPAQMVGRRVDEFLGPELTKEIEPYINRVLAGERVEYEMTYSFPATGNQRMQCTYVPERDSRRPGGRLDCGPRQRHADAAGGSRASRTLPSSSRMPATSSASRTCSFVPST